MARASAGRELGRRVADDGRCRARGLPRPRLPDIPPLCGGQGSLDGGRRRLRACGAAWNRAARRVARLRTVVPDSLAGIACRSCRRATARPVFHRQWARGLGVVPDRVALDLATSRKHPQASGGARTKDRQLAATAATLEAILHYEAGDTMASVRTEDRSHRGRTVNR